MKAVAKAISQQSTHPYQVAHHFLVASFLLLLLSCPISSTIAEDWPQWGRDPTKNMASPDTNDLIFDFKPGSYVGRNNQIDPATTQHIKWIAKLGSQSYGNPTIAGGKVFVGTNNDSPRDPKYKGDRSVVYCLDEESGDLIWQLNIPKLGAGKVSDWEYLGICSSPTVVGNRVYVITSLCEVLCLDIDGMSNGNDGPFTNESQYLTGSGKPPIAMSQTDADIIWRYDMRDELLIFPHNVTSSSVLVIGDYVYATTSNGVDWTHVNIPNPQAPTLIVLDKHTGELVGEEASGISQRVYHCNWSSPASATVDGRTMIFFGAGDGFCYAFDPVPVPDEQGYGILKEIWRFDCNPRQYKFKDNKSIKYATRAGPSEIIATPVFYKDRVYVSIGQDPEHGNGDGALSCIDVTQQGDISKSGLVWRYTDMDRAISTVSIVDGIVYVADYAGFVHCLDADSGQVYWKYDTLGHIWGSTLVADGKIFIGNEDGVLTILKTGKEKKLISENHFEGNIYSSPIVANGVLYVSTQSHLYAIAAQEQ